MQKRVLEKLKETRENGNKKGLVISATGTGKTYLAAMDIKQFFEINSNNKNKLFEINGGKSKILNIKFNNDGTYNCRPDEYLKKIVLPEIKKIK